MPLLLLRADFSSIFEQRKSSLGFFSSGNKPVDKFPELAVLLLGGDHPDAPIGRMFKAEIELTASIGTL
jgi:hypothetical protein